MQQGLPFFTAKTKHILDWRELLDLVFEIKTARLQPGTVSFNAIVTAYGRLSEWQRSLDVLLSLQVEGLQVDGASFGAAISACTKGQLPKAHWPLAFLLFCSARTYASHVSAALSSTLAAITRLPSRWADAEAAFQSAAQKGCVVNIVHHNTVLNGFSQGQQWQLALSRIWLSEADVVSFNTLMDSCTPSTRALGCQRWQLNCALFMSLAVRRLVCTVRSFGTLIASFGRDAGTTEWKHALKTYCTARRLTLEPNSIMAGALAGACSSKHAWERALATATGHEQKVMMMLPTRKWEGAHQFWCRQAASTWQRSLSNLAACGSCMMEGDIVTLCSVAKPLQDAQRWREIMQLLHGFWHLEVNVIAYGLLASACSRSYQWTQALQALGTGRCASLPPDSELHHIASNGCAKNSHWASSLGLLRALDVAKFQLDIASVNSILPGIAMQQFWQRALQTCSTSRYVSMAEKQYFELTVWSSIGKWESAQILLSFGHNASSESYALGLTSMASTGKAREALELFRSMRLKCLRADVPHLVAILVTGCSWELSLDVLHQAQRDGLACGGARYYCTCSNH